jgi:hypothetical protein
MIVWSRSVAEASFSGEQKGNNPIRRKVEKTVMKMV